MNSSHRWQTRRTIVDLYNEREQVSWLWIISAMLSSGTIVLGFVLFPYTYFDQHSDLRSSQTSLTVTSICLLCIGYATSIALIIVCRSWIFHLNNVFLPCLGSCALGLINTLISLGIQISQPWNALNITALGLSAISTIAYTLASAYTYRRISTVRNLDGHRLRQSTSDEDRAVLLPEDELQRQQLLRLLLKRDSDRAPSPEVNKNTFRIDLPTPSSSYSRVQGYLAAPFQNEMRSTSGSSTQPGLFQWTTEAREYYQPSSRDFTFQDIEMDERRGYHVRANSNRV